MDQSFSLQEILMDQLTIPTKLLTHYKTIGLEENDVMVILQLHRFLQEGNDFPTPVEITNHLTITEDDCMLILRKLIQKNLLTIDESNRNNQLSESYNLTPLWMRLYAKVIEDSETENHEGSVFILFEQEFGRLLSPFEIETISAWMDEDKIVPALIKAALRESVLMGKLNFKYIDRILREWKRKWIHSVEQAREEGKTFRENQPKVQKQYNVEKRDTSIYFNWLEGENE